MFENRILLKRLGLFGQSLIHRHPSTDSVGKFIFKSLCLRLTEFRVFDALNGFFRSGVDYYKKHDLATAILEEY